MSSGTPVQRRKLGVCMAKRKQKMKRLDHGGYSLVELMVVIVIMVILASVSIGVYNGYVNRARSAVFYEKGHRIAEAFKICEAEHGLSGEFDKREMAEEIGRDFAFKKKSPILPIIYETKRGIKIRNKNYSFFMYKQSKRTPFRV